ncbi:MAG: NERD domain-containing protein [Thermofilaceae archaeon]|nr:NERD domain-containing protein [Thermofilaceae archaeon]
MSVEEKMLTVIERLLAQGNVDLDALQLESKIKLNLLLEIMCNLPLEVKDGKVVVVDKAELILKSWEMGFNILELAFRSGWKDFEKLCARILERNGYRTLTNFRFKNHDARYEVDVLAFSKPRVLIIDCKRWTRLRGGGIRKAALLQRERGVALSGALWTLRLLQSEVKGWSEARIIPVLVNIHESPFKLHEGVPIVPINKLSEFLNELDAYEEDICSFTVKFPRLL